MIDRGSFMATARLRFGVWRDEDMALAQAIWGDAEVTKLTGGPFTVEDVAERLAVEISNWRLHGIQYWPVFHLSDGRLAGCCGLRPRDMNARIAELGFQFCADAWGQGFATEASTAVIEWARTEGFSALIAGHHPDNLASKRALVRLGFSYTHDELYPPTGLLEPCYLLRLDAACRE
ncbi:GNAT family N-acetyltransferase [Sphingobium sp. JS3065]|uniref:GNAT family N-acetyltransferase n=1 Tax=Sphingobium sp. JS3065 TaxID=2970925 RepID=UPI00226547E7|nr:GNAT family N-acetyltransferase [Sphingobium sp. JS3065]UZW57326.1 GNAT family N-acetyltransferase [Sphingobium sp. JS3065]